ncbi:hypothetical protein BDN72DRAFT_64020 [Pluteus cervinus]|uniref:Uncharacterized protein n=1 Tax=Pluteus cervinus TaxID=181527 RepID=A0ACD3AT37_9AGAR|nr:hypothetical protein BDN72DRAFT_64020 [Pluteus cervinus]
MKTVSPIAIGSSCSRICVKKLGMIHCQAPSMLLNRCSNETSSMQRKAFALDPLLADFVNLKTLGIVSKDADFFIERLPKPKEKGTLSLYLSPGRSLPMRLRSLLMMVSSGVMLQPAGQYGYLRVWTLIWMGEYAFCPISGEVACHPMTLNTTSLCPIYIGFPLTSDVGKAMCVEVLCSSSYELGLFLPAAHAVYVESITKMLHRAWLQGYQVPFVRRPNLLRLAGLH